MKEYIKAIAAGIIAGAGLMQLVNIGVQSLIGRGFVVGGEIFLPVVLAAAVYIGWKLSAVYFRDFQYKEIYNKGFKDGTKLHSYRIVIPLDERYGNNESA